MPVDYLLLQASLQMMLAASRPPSNLPKPNRVLIRRPPCRRIHAQGIVDSVRGQTGTITRSHARSGQNPSRCRIASPRSRKQPHPSSVRPRNRFRILQSLYEKKLTTYPRTDCRYLPEEQFQDAARLITALSGVSGLKPSLPRPIPP
ncbi:MAG: DNA topoisomerase [Bilophila wadsworthia]